MSENPDIPVLTDLIAPGPEITLSDLGLDDDLAAHAQARAQSGDLAFDEDEAAPIVDAAIGDAEIGADPFHYDAVAPTVGHADSTPPAASEIGPALEREVRRILDEHVELAWQEIRLAIQRHLDRS